MIKLTKIKIFYEKYFLSVDFIFSVVLILILIFMLKMDVCQCTNLLNFDKINSAIISFFGTMLGFLITLVTIIYAFSITSNSDSMKRLQKTKIFPKLYSVYFNTMLTSGILVFLGFIGLGLKVPETSYLLFTNWIITLELFFILLFLFRICRCVWILLRLIKLANQSN